MFIVNHHLKCIEIVAINSWIFWFRPILLELNRHISFVCQTFSLIRSCMYTICLELLSLAQWVALNLLLTNTVNKHLGTDVQTDIDIDWDHIAVSWGSNYIGHASYSDFCSIGPADQGPTVEEGAPGKLCPTPIRQHPRTYQ